VFDPNSFFELMNKADEEILHQYHSCNHVINNIFFK